MSSTTESSSKFTLIIIYINIILYATCYQIQRPLEPFLVDKLTQQGDATGDAYANLQSFFSLVQMIGSFLIGIGLDKVGVKGGFIVTFIASALSYGILSQSTSMTMLYISKIPTIFQAGFLCAQVAASQATTDGSERVEALGRLTVCYTIGSVIGPAVGGFLGASGDYYFAAKISAVGSIISMFLTLLMPSTATTPAPIVVNGSTSPQSNQKLNKGESDTGNASTEVESNVASAKTDDPSVSYVIYIVWLYLTTKVVTNIANSMLGSVLPLVLKNSYGLNEKYLGLTMSGMSGFNAVVNGFLLGPIVGLFHGDLNLLIGLCMLLMSCLSILQAVTTLPFYAGLSYNSGLFEFMIATFALSMCQYVLATTITGESTSRVGQRSKGTLLGLEHTIFAAVRIFSPKAGVILLQSGGVPAVAGACAITFGANYGLWQFCSDTSKSATNGHVNGERKEK